MRLQWCEECHKDYPANKWKQSPIHLGPYVTGWVCPKGHEMRLCNEGKHVWSETGPISQECTRCYAVRVGTMAELGLPSAYDQPAQPAAIPAPETSDGMTVDEAYLALVEARKGTMTKTTHAALEVIYNWLASAETLPDGRVIVTIGHKPEDLAKAKSLFVTMANAYARSR